MVVVVVVVVVGCAVRASDDAVLCCVCLSEALRGRPLPLYNHGAETRQACNRRRLKYSFLLPTPPKLVVLGSEQVVTSLTTAGLSFVLLGVNGGGHRRSFIVILS